MLKRAWVTNIGSYARPIYAISTRSEDGSISISEPMELPPRMKSYKKDELMGIDEARELGVQEIHRHIGMFTFEDLVILRDALIRATEGLDG